MLPQEVTRLFPVNFRSQLHGLHLKPDNQIEEIRLRVNYPIQVIAGDEEGFIGNSGILESGCRGQSLTADILKQILLVISGGSMYTLEEDMPRGFTTIAGGHRIGFAGEVVAKEGIIKNLSHITFMNIRIAREIKDSARSLIPYLMDRKAKRVLSTLIISPPGAGKTTLLRDLVRLCSRGVYQMQLPGVKVCLVDERSEIAGSYQGIPQLDVGPRTDVLDKCPKNKGLFLLIRAMSPRILACDELGQDKDYEALLEASRAGVDIITTVHGTSLPDLQKKPGLAKILASNFFQRFVLLSKRKGPGTVEKIFTDCDEILFEGEAGELAENTGSVLSVDRQ